MYSLIQVQYIKSSVLPSKTRTTHILVIPPDCENSFLLLSPATNSYCWSTRQLCIIFRPPSTNIRWKKYKEIWMMIHLRQNVLKDVTYSSTTEITLKQDSELWGKDGFQKKVLSKLELLLNG